MNHQQRMEACLLVTDKILKKYGKEILATAVSGSTGRGTDMKNSDIDFATLVKSSGKMHKHRFVLMGCLFSVAARTEEDWTEELTAPNYQLPLVVGSLESLHAIYDPHGRFDRLREKSERLPTSCWRNAVRVGLEEMVEDLGRVRNAYLSRNLNNFWFCAPGVVETAALVHSSLRRKSVLTENDLLNRRAQGYTPKFFSSLLVGAGVKEARPRQALDSLETLYDSLYHEAKDQDAIPVSYDSALSYTPP